MIGWNGSASPCASTHAFQAHLAGVVEDALAVVAFEMLVEMPGLAFASVDASVALRTCSGSRRQRPIAQLWNPLSE